MDRIAKLGNGLTAAQRNNYILFKDEWDAKMVEEHGDSWPRIFCERMAGVLAELEHNPNAFSVFMFHELHRTFDGMEALTIPGHLR